MKYNRDEPKKTIRTPGIVCRHCEIPFSATSVLSDDGNFACRILYCEQCKTIVDKNWWSMPQMMAKHSGIKKVDEATADWDGVPKDMPKPPASYTEEYKKQREAPKPLPSLVNRKFVGMQTTTNGDLHEQGGVGELKSGGGAIPPRCSTPRATVVEKYVCHCTYCGEAGHNKRTCKELRYKLSKDWQRGQEKKYAKEQQALMADPPGFGTLQSCSVCGAQGHNKRTCENAKLRRL